MMKKIKRLICKIDDELKGAKDYSECYLDFKAKGDSTMSTRYKEMATDELKHAMYIHDHAVKEIEDLNKVYTPPQKMQDEWDKTHKEYLEKVAWIKQMLAM